LLGNRDTHRYEKLTYNYRVPTQFDVMNSRTFKDLCNEIQGFSSTCPVFKYFQGLEFRRKNSGLSRMHGNPVITLQRCPAVNQTHELLTTMCDILLTVPLSHHY